MNKHNHTHDHHGKMTCACSKTQTLHQHNDNTDIACCSENSHADSPHTHAENGGSCSSGDSDDEDGGGCCSHSHTDNPFSHLPTYLPPIISFALSCGLSCFAVIAIGL